MRIDESGDMNAVKSNIPRIYSTRTMHHLHLPLHMHVPKETALTYVQLQFGHITATSQQHHRNSKFILQMQPERQRTIDRHAAPCKVLAKRRPKKTWFPLRSAPKTLHTETHHIERPAAASVSIVAYNSAGVNAKIRGWMDPQRKTLQRYRKKKKLKRKRSGWC